MYQPDDNTPSCLVVERDIKVLTMECDQHCLGNYSCNCQQYTVLDAGFDVARMSKNGHGKDGAAAEYGFFFVGSVRKFGRISSAVIAFKLQITNTYFYCHTKNM